MHIPPKRDSAIGAVHRDVIGIKLGVTFQGLFDGMVNVSRVRCGTQQVDVVLNTDNAQDVGRDELGFITLVLAT